MRVALFITCFNDTLLPDAGRATVALLERLGCQVDFPLEQTCCGQMHGNSGYEDEARPLAERFQRVFGDAEVVVSPSASCVGFLEAAVTDACAERGARRLVVPRGAPRHLRGLELVIDEPPLTARALDQVDGVLTGCALAIAETGTLVLDGGERSGRRALTLVPDFHVCLVQAADIHASVPDAIAALGPAAAEGRPITLVSGPSATSDIELERVEGVHGPRDLVILVVES